MSGEDDGNKSPECVELPHVAEVAEGRGAKGPRSKNHGKRLRIELGALTEVRSIRNREEHGEPASGGEDGDREADRSPREALPERFDEMRKGSTQHQRPDEKTDGVAKTSLIPAGGDFHSDRIDAREKEARDKAEGKQRKKSVGKEIECQVGCCTGQRTQQEDLAW